MQPLLPDAPVEVQQQNADLTTWTTVAVATVAADGTFSLPVQLTAGATYRVSRAPAAGFAPGTHVAASRGALMRRALLALAVAAARGGGARGGVHAGRPARVEAVVPPGRPRVRRRGRSRRRSLAPVKVAIVDSGVDCSLPDFQGRLLDARSFVGGDPCLDTEGHGTFIAGEIAANLDTQGIVGIAYTSQLLVAKVVKPDGTIPLAAEAAAIRWAADNGARVINLSLGGVRDPCTRTATRTRRSRRRRSRTRPRRAPCSSRRSATGTRRSRSRGRSRAIRRRCRT